MAKKEKSELEQLFSDDAIYGISFNIHAGGIGLGAKVYRDESKGGRTDTAEIRMWIGKGEKVDMYLSADQCEEVARRFKIIAKVLKARNKAQDVIDF